MCVVHRLPVAETLLTTPRTEAKAERRFFSSRVVQRLLVGRNELPVVELDLVSRLPGPLPTAAERGERTTVNLCSRHFNRNDSGVSKTYTSGNNGSLKTIDSVFCLIAPAIFSGRLSATCRPLLGFPSSVTPTKTMYELALFDDFYELQDPSEAEEVSTPLGHQSQGQ